MFKFVNERIPNHEQLEEALTKIADGLEYEKQKKFDQILDGMGLEVVMGVVAKKGSVK